MLWVALLLACGGLDEDGFLDKYTEELCSIEEECFRENFVLTYDNDLDVCFEDLRFALREDFFDRECVGFSEEKAKECLADLTDKDISCRTFQAGDFVSANCDGVYLCAIDPEPTPETGDDDDDE